MNYALDKCIRSVYLKKKEIFFMKNPLVCLKLNLKIYIAKCSAKTKLQ